MSSGNSVVSQSINANASRLAQKPLQASAVAVAPHRMPQYANSSPVNNSTTG